MLHERKCKNQYAADLSPGTGAHKNREDKLLYLDLIGKGSDQNTGKDILLACSSRLLMKSAAISLSPAVILSTLS